MPAGLSEPAGAAPSAVMGAPGTEAMAPAGALPVRVDSTSVTLGAVTQVESVASQPLRSPLGTLVTKVAPVSALPKLSGGPRLPAPQIVTVKAPNTTTIQLPASVQLPPVPAANPQASLLHCDSPSSHWKEPHISRLEKLGPHEDSSDTASECCSPWKKPTSPSHSLLVTEITESRSPVLDHLEPMNNWI
ncbi:transcription initiation factor TFIID subunit 4B-like [Castor canadensis]|uniref:Transcription initiation factor TFIID subunit 4B-like n=1 Tax=Castor canadensis TaxID=51338 RepID=A0AC58MA81_CASCN